MKDLLRNMLTLLLLAAALNSCIFSEIREDEPVGESCVLDMSLTFKPMESVSPGTRTAGNAIRHIESLWFLAYNEDGSLYSKTRIASYTQVQVQPAFGPLSLLCRCELRPEFLLRQ